MKYIFVKDFEKTKAGTVINQFISPNSILIKDGYVKKVIADEIFIKEESPILEDEVIVEETVEATAKPKTKATAKPKTK